MSDVADPGVLVVKLGGTTIAEEHAVLSEIATLAADRPIVVVHGGGKRLTEWLGASAWRAASRPACG